MTRIWLAACTAAALAALMACAPLNTTAPPAAAGTRAPAPSPTPPPPPRQAAPGGTRCHTGQLRVRVAPADSAAGHLGLRVVFTNTTTRACTMYGYPGVSFLSGPRGRQLGVPAERSAARGAPMLISVAPGGAAHADLLLTNTANFAAGTCKPSQAAGVRVYPPDETAAVFAAYPLMVCAHNGVGAAEIYPVADGAGGP
jgi:hypothetical protein